MPATDLNNERRISMNRYSLKQKIIKGAKMAGGFICVLAGLAIGGFGIAQFMPEQKYAELPKRDESEDN
jgi:hypothetical protein